MRTRFAILGLAALLVTPVLAADNVQKAPPGGNYKKVSELVKLPDFLPSLGQLFVDPVRDSPDNSRIGAFRVLPRFRQTDVTPVVVIYRFHRYRSNSGLVMPTALFRHHDKDR